MSATEGKHSKLILAAMIFAVSMTFIDQTIGSSSTASALCGATQTARSTRHG